MPSAGRPYGWFGYAVAQKRLVAISFGLVLARLLRAKHPKGSRVEMYDDRVDEQLAEFRAKLAANDARRSAAGIDALMDQCEAIWGQADAVLDKIDKTRPTTVRGVLAVFDFNTEKERDYWPEEAIGGLREIAKREAKP